MLKATFISGILLGLTAVVATAGLYPWIDHERLESQTQVVPNGGRSEAFLIRLPVDRIASLGTDNLGLGASSFPDGLALPQELAAAPTQIDHFKVRDAAGNVIGVASRHAVVIAGSAAVTWSLSFPSRGALWLTGQFNPTALETAAANAGYAAGQTWAGDLELLVGTAQAPAGEVRGGTREFSALVGSFTERWHLTGIGADSALRGTITLDTTTYLAQ